ncbi:MAG TPA: ABC transporter ATP-binding protein, partial [Ktedonobacterales bacterium]|nr:ABC transporter ATP-binding protein [Ktedonobacterales bacterium]
MAQSFFQEDEILGKAYDARLVRRLWDFVWPYRRLVWLTLLVALVSVGNDLLAPYITQVAIDRYIAPVHPGGLSAPARMNGVLLFALLYLLTLCLGFGLRYVQNFVLSLIGQRVMYDMRSAMFEHLQRLSLSFFDHNPVGRLMTRITNDIDSLDQLFRSGSVALVGDVLTLLGIIIVLFLENWRLALIVCIVFPPLALVTRYFQGVMRDTFRQIRVRLARINANVAENIAGTQVVQLFNRENRNFEYFDQLNLDYFNSSLRSLFYFA